MWASTTIVHDNTIDQVSMFTYCHLFGIKYLGIINDDAYNKLNKFQDAFVEWWRVFIHHCEEGKYIGKVYGSLITLCYTNSSTTAIL